MSVGVYEEPLLCGGKLKVTNESWEISYYFPGPDFRYNGTFFSVRGDSVEKYIVAFEENWKEYEKLKPTIPEGAEFTKPGKMGMDIRIGKLSQGVCIKSYHMPISSKKKLEEVISGYKYALKRALQVQNMLATL